MTLFRLFFLSLVLTTSLSCRSLNYPEPEPAAEAASTSGPGANTSSPSATAVPGAAGGLHGLPGEDLASEDKALAWSDLTRLAREHSRRGELIEAEERLDQAAAQVAYLPANHARRRTVFGMQARLASQLAEQGEVERSDEMANQLFDIAEAEPEIGGDALVTLAVSVVARRSQTEEPFPTEEKLRILRIALSTAQAGSITRQRFQLAFEISQEAQRSGDLELARQAIDQAQADARVLFPSDKSQAASIAIYRSRIALEQNDFDTAEADAIRANRIFEEADAPDGERGIGEITLAQALAGKGDTEMALLVAGTAQARLAAQPPIPGHLRRTILGGLARVEALADDRDSARLHFREALDIPAEDFEADRRLVRELALDLKALDAPFAEAAPDSNQDQSTSQSPDQNPSQSPE